MQMLLHSYSKVLSRFQMISRLRTRRGSCSEHPLREIPSRHKWQFMENTMDKRDSLEREKAYKREIFLRIAF
jgi:hypothetical protein